MSSAAHVQPSDRDREDNALPATQNDAADPLYPFHLLQQTPRFGLDLQALEEHVLRLQLQHHPDRYARNTTKQAEAQEHFSKIIWAWQQVTDPHTRATLLFKAQGLWPVPHDPMVLADLMTWEEEAEDGSLKAEKLKATMAEALQDLGIHLDAQAWQKAGTAFMLWNGLKRLQKAWF